MKEIREILATVSAFTCDERGVLATVIDVRGSGYRMPGARMLILANGETVGTVSGGCLEADVLARAKKVLATGRSEVFTYDTTENEDSIFSLNMGCRGVIEISLEPIGRDSPLIAEMRTAYEKREQTANFEPPIFLLLFGAGADALPMTKIVSELGWQVTVHDHRPAFLTAERFPTARELVLQKVDGPLEPFNADNRTAAVIMTHNYGRDRKILPALLRSDVFYIGALGPKRRTEQLLEDLASAGNDFSDKQLARLYAPVGLDIGADTPEGIALAIVGEIQSVLANRDGGHLRNREGSIYDRK